MRVLGPLLRARAKRTHHHIAHYERVLGTSLELQISGESEVLTKRAEAAALAEIDRLTPIFNRFTPNSELSKWESTSGDAVKISPELLEVLEQAELWRTKTESAFHPAAEAFVQVWRQGDALTATQREDRIAEILPQMNRPQWEVNRAAGTARRTTTLPVSLNSIAKGFIADSACRAAADIEGISQCLVNVGGDIRHRGDGHVSVGIADPFAPGDNAEPLTRVRLSNTGIATSGPKFRGYEVGGRTYSHLIDPRSGLPVEGVLSVSVVAPTCALADALSTAFSVMTPEASMKLAGEIPGVACLLVTQEGERHQNYAWILLSAAATT